jgi:hypothetical protein
VSILKIETLLYEARSSLGMRYSNYKRISDLSIVVEVRTFFL